MQIAYNRIFKTPVMYNNLAEIHTRKYIRDTVFVVLNKLTGSFLASFSDMQEAKEYIKKFDKEIK
jgi:hypothetical protein